MFTPDWYAIRRLALLLGAVAACWAEGQPPALHGTPTSGYAALVQSAKSRIKQMNIEQYQRDRQAGEALLLVDVREEVEWKAGHARGALHLSRGILERDIESKVPDKSAKIVLYCSGGSRSALAAESLQKLGYHNVYSLEGGFSAYRRAGLPVVQPLPQ